MSGRGTWTRIFRYLQYCAALTHNISANGHCRKPSQCALGGSSWRCLSDFEPALPRRLGGWTVLNGWTSWFSCPQTCPIGFANTFALGRGQRGLRGGSRGMESVAWPPGSHACPGPWRVGKGSIANRQTESNRHEDTGFSVQCCNFRPKVWQQLVEVCPQPMENFRLAPRWPDLLAAKMPAGMTSPSWF